MKASPKSCDIFCRIIDNYGDIGICWRLARQLAHEHGLAVRLWIDHLATAKHLIPQIQIEKLKQTVEGIAIHHWREHFEPLELVNLELPDIIIEAFACELPDCYLQAMTQSQPIWLNLEYLSAESWVDGFHSLSSKHPTLGLSKTFFFPGFTNQTGGLIREKRLIEKRIAFQQSNDAQQAFWQSLNVLIPAAALNDALKVSLFCYPQAHVIDLLQSFINAAQPVICLVPGNTLIPLIRQHFAADISGQMNLGKLSLGNLSLQPLPFLSQDQYDHLLWACDLNFVRGEDSWIRAIWAAKPMIWQAYQQAEQAHLVKLNAFLDLYTQELPDESKQLVKRFSQAWSSNHLNAGDWQQMIDHMPEITAHSKKFSSQLAKQTDLAARLVSFCKNQTYPV